MPNIILNRTIVEDQWQLLGHASHGSTTDTTVPAALPSGNIIVPLATWQAQHTTLRQRGAQNAVGIWLKPEDDPAVLAQDISTLPLIAVDFPAFRDGRGYSTAYLLRNRYGYQGELRAIGDVARDQLFYLQRVGFNSFAVRADKDIEVALAGLNDFSEVYQASTDQPLPYFRRRATHAPDQAAS